MALFGRKKEEEAKKPDKELEAFKEQVATSNGNYISKMFVQGDMIGDRFATAKVYEKVADVANTLNLRIVNMSRYDDQAITVMFEIKNK